MSKRGAERQLTKSDDEEEVEEVGYGFKKAQDSTLASRPMRGLPKRTLGGFVPVTPSASVADAPPTAKFGAFAGFSGSSTNSSPFSSSPSPSPTPLVQSNSGPNLGSSVSPSVSPSASNAAKAFASFIESSPSVASTPPKEDTPMVTDDVTNTPEYKYWASLRGLNLSFISAVTKAVDEDPFVDIAEVLERYKSLRTGVQREFDGSKGPTPAPAPTAPPAPQPPPSMPKPPTIFAGFGAQSGSSKEESTTKPASGGFVPILGSISAKSSASPFSLPSPAPSSSTTEHPKTPLGGSFSIFGSSAPTPSSNPFGTPSFGAPAPSALGTAPAKATTSSSQLTFGATKPESETSNSSSSSSSPTPNFFGASPSKPVAPTGGFFGSSSTSSPFRITPSPPKGTGTFGGFGGLGKTSPGGSIGNPVGFGFGGAPSTSFGFGFGGGASTSSGFGAFGDAKKVAVTESQESVVSDGGTDDSTDSEAKTSILLGTSPHDEEGEGEEGEETTHAIKLKAFRMRKKDEEGGAGWVDLGAGVLRLKKNRDTDSRRMLLRNSSTGKININFNLYDGLQPSLSKKTIAFIGHDNGVAQSYTVRTKTEEQARELKDALDREIAFVKAKSSD